MLNIKCYACQKKGHVFKGCKEIQIELPKTTFVNNKKVNNQRKLLVRFPKRSFNTLKCFNEAESSAFLVQEKYKEFFDDSDQEKGNMSIEDLGKNFFYKINTNTCLDLSETKHPFTFGQNKRTLIESRGDKLLENNPHSIRLISPGQHGTNLMVENQEENTPPISNNNLFGPSFPILEPTSRSRRKTAKQTIILNKKKKMIQDLKRRPVDCIQNTNHYFPFFNVQFLCGLINLNEGFIERSEKPQIPSMSPLIMSFDKIESDSRSSSIIPRVENGKDSSIARLDDSIHSKILKIYTNNRRSSQESLMDRKLDLTAFSQKKLGILKNYEEEDDSEEESNPEDS